MMPFREWRKLFQMFGNGPFRSTWKAWRIVHRHRVRLMANRST